MSIIAGKTLMITGGTGSFGNAVMYVACSHARMPCQALTTSSMQQL